MRPFILLVVAVVGCSFTMDIVVPAYFRTPSDWAAMSSAASDVSITAILNPGSGPGSYLDSVQMKPLVDNLRASGGKVIAYVHSSYTQRALSAIKADIDTYLGWYSLDGFFIDEMNNNGSATVIQYYQNLYSYIKAKSSSYVVVQNPGWRVPESYVTSQTADRFMTFESAQPSYSLYSSLPWDFNYPASTFIHLIYDATLSNLTPDVDFAASKNIGGIYITNRTLTSNPWGSLPSYWSQEVAYVKTK